MTPLISLEIWNFQAHKHEVFELDPHLTVFVGRNDVGKSSALRALRWLCHNRPRSDRMIRKGCDWVKVKLTMQDHTIVRKRSKKENSYYLDGKKFSAVSGNVPQQIQDILRTADASFQRQIDPPYLFTETPGQVSKELNRIVNLGSIDDALSKIATEVRRSRSEVEVSESRLREARKTKKALEWVKEFNTHLRSVEKVYDVWIRLEKRYGSLFPLLREAETLHQESVRMNNLYGDLDGLTNSHLDYLELIGKEEWLSSIVVDMERAAKDAARPVPDLTEAEEAIAEIATLEEKILDLSTLIEEIEEGEKERWKAEKFVEESSAKMEKLTKGRCPICGAKMTKSLLS